MKAFLEKLTDNEMFLSAVIGALFGLSMYDMLKRGDHNGRIVGSLEE